MSKYQSIRITAEQKEFLISHTGRQIINGESWQISLWEKGGNSRLYVEAPRSASGRNQAYLDLNDESDLTIGFINDEAAHLLAWLESQMATSVPAPSVDVSASEALIPVDSAPTVEQTQEALDAVGFTDKAAEYDGQYLAYDFEPTAANLRLAQFKMVWQKFVVTPLFKALPEDEQRPYRWNELCVAHDGEWDEIVKAAISGLVGWDDHLLAFRQDGAALRAL